MRSVFTASSASRPPRTALKASAASASTSIASKAAPPPQFASCRAEFQPFANSTCQLRSNHWRISREARSEEHTSELQSHLNLVCRLLLEKKKTRISLHDYALPR